MGTDYFSTTTELPPIDGPASLKNDFDLALDADFWSNAIEEDSFYSPLPFDASERGLWNGRFVPPPPRPPFWDDSITSDGLTTCDLCTWASHERNAYGLDGSISGKFFIFLFFFTFYYSLIFVGSILWALAYYSFSIRLVSLLNN